MTKRTKKQPEPAPIVAAPGTIALNINTGHIKAALLCAAKNDVRFYLCGVLIEIKGGKGFVVGTNGHVLFAATFPASDVPDTQFVVPRILLDGKHPTPTIGVTYDGSRVTIISGFERTASAISCKYPDWRAVLPTEADGKAGHYALHYMDLAAKVAKACDVRYPAITQNGDKAGILVLGDDASMILMPQRVSPPKIKAFWA